MDGHDNLYALVVQIITAESNSVLRTASTVTSTPFLARFTRTLSLCSAKAILGSITGGPGTQAAYCSITANTRGDVWFAGIPLVNGTTIQYDGITLPAGSGTQGSYFLIHASVDSATHLVGYAESVTAGIAQTRWPALLVPRSTPNPGEEIGLGADVRFHPSTQTRRLAHPSLDVRGASLGSSLLLTPHTDE